jgi:hypothetical protein
LFGQKVLNAAVSLAAMAAAAARSRGWQKISIILGVCAGTRQGGQDALAISHARAPARLYHFI